LASADIEIKHKPRYNRTMSKLNIVEPFDENVKAYLRDELEKLGLHVETEYETFSHARTVDLVAECQEADKAKLVNTIFDYFMILKTLCATRKECCI